MSAGAEPPQAPSREVLERIANGQPFRTTETLAGREVPQAEPLPLAEPEPPAKPKAKRTRRPKDAAGKNSAA